MAYRLHLLSNEKIEREARPHFIAFIDLYFIWAALILISLIGLSFKGAMTNAVNGTFFKEFVISIPADRTELVLCSLINFLVALIPVRYMSYYKITARWIYLIMGICGISLILSIFSNLSPNIIYALPHAIGFLGISQVEIYRRAHKFFVTNRRLVFVRDYIIMTKDDTTMYYTHINSVTLKQTTLEAFFRCGTVIPVTSSGMNLGEEIQQMNPGLFFFGFSTGRGKLLPRAIPFLCFYSVSRPHEVRRLIDEKCAKGMK